MRLAYFIFLIFVSPSFAAQPDCIEATSIVAAGENTQQFKQLLEHLVVSKRGLAVEALKNLAETDNPTNPAVGANLSPYDQHVIARGFEQMLAEKNDPLDWDNIRHWIGNDFLEKLGERATKREEAKEETELLPIPNVLQTLPVVQGNTTTVTTTEHTSGFIRENQPYGVMRTSEKGLVAINLNDGKMDVLNPENRTVRNVAVLAKRGKVYVVTNEGAPVTMMAYQMGGGVPPKLLVDPFSRPVNRFGLSVGMVGGKAVAVSAVHPSQFLNQTMRNKKPGFSLYYLDENKKTDWIDSDGLYLRDPTLATIGQYSFISGIDEEGKSLFIADPTTGKKISRTKINGYRSNELFRATNAPHFYEIEGEPRIIVPVHTGFEVLNPLTGESIKTIPAQNTQSHKGMRTISANGKLYGVTNSGDKAIVLNLSDNKLVAEIPSPNAEITSEVFPVKKGHRNYLTWSTSDGQIYMADLSGALLSSVQVTKGQIKNYYPITIGDETRALVAPHNTPAMIIDLFSKQPKD